MATSPRGVLLAALSENPTAFRTASADLRGDRRAVLAAISVDPEALKFASTDLRADQDVVLAAIHANPNALQWAAPALRDLPEVVIPAVERDGWVLRYAGPAAQANPAVVLPAVRQCGRAYRHAAPALFNSRELCLEAVRSDGEILGMDELWQYWDDPEMLVAAASSRGDILFWLPERWRRDVDVIRAAVGQSGMALRCVPPERITYELCLLAVRQTWMALVYVPPLFRDEQLLLEAVAQWPESEAGPEDWNLRDASTTRVHLLSGEYVDLPENDCSEQKEEVLLHVIIRRPDLARPRTDLTLVHEGSDAPVRNLARLSSDDTICLLEAGRRAGLCRRVPHLTVVARRL